MKQQYILYSLSNPFAGYIVEWGNVDPDRPLDGSTVMEYITRRLADHVDLRLSLLPLGSLQLTEEIRETKKIDTATGTLVNQSPADITPAEKSAIVATARESSISSNLPSWTAVSNAVDGIGSLADAKVYLKKLSRVVYWLAKNSEV